jgi:ferritin-like metal-binding protein YciE
MGHTQVVKLLDQTLQEEKNADSKLTEVAESTVNEEAAAE